MSQQLSDEADRRLTAALQETGRPDPRELCRERLRELKRADDEAYREAVEFYAETLIPEIASGGRDPLQAWTEYGGRLATALAPGRTVSIDESGRAHHDDTYVPERMVLHVPADKAQGVLLVALPAALSPAQEATYDVLIAGKHRLRS